MAIQVGGVVFGLGNPFAGMEGSLELQEIWVEAGGVGKKSSHPSGAGMADLWHPTP